MLNRLFETNALAEEAVGHESHQQDEQRFKDRQHLDDLKGVEVPEARRDQSRDGVVKKWAWIASRRLVQAFTRRACGVMQI